MAVNGDGTPSIPRGESPTGSPRSASISLQAAAAVNAGLQREPSRRKLQQSDDRKSTLVLTPTQSHLVAR